MITIIDCAVKNPVYTDFNEIIQREKIAATYHLPAMFGSESLKKIKSTTGIIIGGSFSNIEDNFTWHKDIVDFVLPFLKNNIPTLGICFGHQLMAHTFGCTIGYITENKDLFKGPREVSFDGNFLGLSKIDKLEFIFSQRQEIKKISNEIEPMAHSILKYDAIKHKELPFYGVQFHPERLEDSQKEFIVSDEVKNNGAKLIHNFLRLTK